MMLLTRYYFVMTATDQIRSLINRLARLDAADIWEADVNPAQLSALEYLSRANRFSRSPSHVAEYLGTTRGTMSQTLKALERKGYVKERRSENDKRSISYDLTQAGSALADRGNATGSAIDSLNPEEKAQLKDYLSAILSNRLAVNAGRPFGICSSCKHNRKTADGSFCDLLSVALEPAETQQICNEQTAA